MASKSIEPITAQPPGVLWSLNRFEESYAGLRAIYPERTHWIGKIMLGGKEPPSMKSNSTSCGTGRGSSDHRLNSRGDLT